MKDSESLDSAAPFWVMDSAVEFESGFDGGVGGRRHFWNWVGAPGTFCVERTPEGRKKIKASPFVPGPLRFCA